MRFDYVYLIRLNGLTKIGKASHPKFRIQQLQCGCPYRFDSYYFKQVMDASGLEYGLHKEYENKKVLGEWFSLTKHDLEWIKKVITSQEVTDEDLDQ
jgi:hypothetical protein